MEHIQEVLNSYFKAWNDGFSSKEDTQIRAMMSKDFKGYWGHATIEEPMQYSYDYDIVSVLDAYNDAEKTFEPLSVTERHEGNQVIVMGAEKNIIQGKPHQARCMLIWQKEDNEWKLLREYIELEK